MAGIAAAWMADLIPGRRAWRTAPAAATWFARAGNGLTLVCAGLAASPDLDLLVQRHRTVTHSVGAVAVVGVVAALAAAQGKWPMRRVSLMCAAAYATHLLLDWLCADYTPPYGLQMLWPFSNGWYISGWEVFRRTARLQVFTASVMRINALAVAQEIAILLPVLAALWLIRVKALAGLATEVARRDHAPQ
jgi:membrane-bound metal-dependent hydrolase YbcI (DUF457 family)